MITEDELSVERLSETLERLAKACQNGSLTLGQLIDQLHVKGPMFSCLVFAAPFLMPIPLPGLSTVFGAVILLGGFQILLDRDLWIPKAWEAKQIPVELSEKIIRRFANLLKKSEHLIKPRHLNFARSWGVRVCNGIMLLVLAALLALPMPPGFNAPPALAICILTTASMEDDGVWLVVSWVLTVLNILLFTAFFALGWEGLKLLLHLS